MATRPICPDYPQEEVHAVRVRSGCTHTTPKAGDLEGTLTERLAVREQRALRARYSCSCGRLASQKPDSESFFATRSPAGNR